MRPTEINGSGLKESLLLMTPERKNVLNQILLDVNKSINRSKVYATDLVRINDCEWWPLAFLLAHRNDVHITSAVIQECLRWRKSFNIYGMRMIEFITGPEKICIYIRGEDLHGNRILWIKLNEHDPANRSIDRLLVYWLETNLIEREMSPLTVVMDFSGAKSFDSVFAKFFVHLFKYFYPGSLGTLLLYDVPPRLRPSVRIMQSNMANYDLPKAIEIADHNEIRTFVSKEQLPRSMNGTDLFTMIDLANCAPPRLMPEGETLAAAVVSEEQQKNDGAIRPSIDDVVAGKRSVRFEESTMAPNGDARSSSVMRKNHIPLSLRPVADARKQAPPADWFDAGFVAINPKDEILLKQSGEDMDPVDLFAIKNTGKKGLQFKIKTTSPEKFRVRPSTGFVASGETDFVRIHLQNDYKATMKAEKFLFVGVQTDDENVENFAAILREAAPEDKVEKQFGCSIQLREQIVPQQADTLSNYHADRRASLELNAENAELRKKIVELGQRQMLIICMLLFLLIVHLISVVQFRSAIDGLTDVVKDCGSAVTVSEAEHRHSDL